MIEKLQHFFESFLAADEGGRDKKRDEERLKLAVAVLLLEIADSDFAQTPDERREIEHVIGQHFALTGKQAEALVVLAEAEHAAATDYFQFTRLINQHYTPEEKIRLIEALWRVAFADGKLHRYEEHVIRRLSDLLHVSHSSFIETKLRIIEET
jgi:uncharacterized tellurite resistance protein B-like protein